MLAGPPSAGKTHIVKVLATEIGTPLVTTDAYQLNAGVNIAGKAIAGGPDTLIHLIHDAWAKSVHGPLDGVQHGSFAYYELPAMQVFIDEIHGLRRKCADALLKATERADAKLFGKNSVMDCRNVLWIGATTDWGKLPPAFRTRFMRVDLFPPTADEVAQIVKLNNRDWDDALCEQVVFYGSTVPREALAFARSVRRYSDRLGQPPHACVMGAAKREGIDQWGMRKQRLNILVALNANPAGLILRSLSAAVGMAPDEVVNHWLPGLMFANPPLVYSDRTGYHITADGKAELVKRGI
jgi:Holliday junction resolvasome RuvABC ATP-dependent DNA helicase subunit